MLSGVITDVISTAEAQVATFPPSMTQETERNDRIITDEMLTMTSPNHETLTQMEMILSLCFFVVAAQVVTNNSIYLPYPGQILLATARSKATKSRNRHPFSRETKEKAKMSESRTD